MQITPKMRSELKVFAAENLKFTHAVVSASTDGPTTWKYEGHRNYCSAQAATADYAIEDTDCLMVNLVTL